MRDEPHPILVVDDDRELRESVIEALEDGGYTVVGARDGRDAIAQLTAMARLPCLIVLDVMMPVMDGREFRKQQLATPLLRDVPVVVMTAGGHAKELRAEMHPVALLPKPFSLQGLMSLVVQHCSY